MSGNLPKNPLLATGGSFSLADSFGSAALAPLPVVAPLPARAAPLPLSTPPTVRLSSAEEDSFLGGGSNNATVTGYFHSPMLPPTSNLGVGNPAAAPPVPTNPPPPRTSYFPSPLTYFLSQPGSAPDPAQQQQTPVNPGLSPQSVELTAPFSTATYSPPLTLSTPVPPKLISAPETTASAIGAISKPPLPLFSPLHPTTSSAPSTASALKRPVYAPDPFMGGAKSSAITTLPPLNSGSTLHYSQSTISFSSMAAAGGVGGDLSSVGGGMTTSHSSPSLQEYHNQSLPEDRVTHHWFYLAKKDPEIWKPFGCNDSFAVEAAFVRGDWDAPIPVEGTRYDVNIRERVKHSVYWQDQPTEIRRCSWFHRLSGDGRWIPYEEKIAERLEEEYVAAAKADRWQKKVVFEDGDWVMLHSPQVMMHFPTASASFGTLDDWGQVQLPASMSAEAAAAAGGALKPRVVHRGLEGLPEIPDGEADEVDHLVFVVHGIGAACDIKFRSIFEVVDNYREMTEDMSQKHFAGAHLASTANRLEFLPVNWHSKLHGEDEGTDNRLKPLTLRSIPKMRSFVNDTLLDVLFYTSPIYCQTILDTVCSEINRVYALFCKRNPAFSGGVSLIGHSLGSLILFDLLAGQVNDAKDTDGDNATTYVLEKSPKPPGKPRWESELSLEEVFAKLGLSQEQAEAFTSQGITITELENCSEEDLMDTPLSPEFRVRLYNYLEARRHAQKGSFKEFQESAVTSRVEYTVGPAGTGQPFVRYPKLNIKPEAFFAFGSPIGMFMSVRGMESLGPEFRLPTCPRFFNIFHPYDPVAYRIESLVNPELAELRPFLIPHHKGRKRMHLELKETMARMGTDLKQKVMESLKIVYNLAGTFTGSSSTVEETTEELVDRNSSPTQDIEDMATTIPANLNGGGRRIDYVLQEAPMESFNEYLFALASHLCYWQSEDTCLMVLREIYSIRGILADDQMTSSTDAVSVAGSASTGPSGSKLPPPPPVVVFSSPSSVSTPPVAPSATPSPNPYLPPSTPYFTPLGLSSDSLPSVSPYGPPLLPPTPLQSTSSIGPPSAATASPYGPPLLPSATLPSTPSVGPPTAAAASPYGPPVLPLASSVASPSNTVAASSAAAAVPPPLLFSPSDLIGFTPQPPPLSRLTGSSISTSTPLGYPRPPPLQSTGGSSGTPQLGMDPTAPMGDGAPVGPPPTTGFQR